MVALQMRSLNLERVCVFFQVEASITEIIPGFNSLPEKNISVNNSEYVESEVSPLRYIHSFNSLNHTIY